MGLYRKLVFSQISEVLIKKYYKENCPVNVQFFILTQFQGT